MTLFQLVSAGLFVALLLVTYRKELFARLSSSPKSAATGSGANTSIAVPLVNDILAVTQLRDKLAAEGYKEGVDACTILLRVIVEYEQPSKGVV